MDDNNAIEYADIPIVVLIEETGARKGLRRTTWTYEKCSPPSRNAKHTTPTGKAMTAALERAAILFKIKIKNRVKRDYCNAIPSRFASATSSLVANRPLILGRDEAIRFRQA